MIPAIVLASSLAAPCLERGDPPRPPLYLASALSNGLAVWSLECPGLEQAYVSVVLRAERQRDPPRLAGLSHLAALAYTWLPFTAENADNLGARIRSYGYANPSFHPDHTIVTVVLRDAADLALVATELGEWLLTPSVPRHRLDWVRSQEIERRLRDEARSPADGPTWRALRALVWPAEPSMAQSYLGTSETLAKATHRRVERTLRRRIDAGHVAVLVHAPLAGDEVVDLLEAALGALPAGSWTPPPAPRPLAAPVMERRLDEAADALSIRGIAAAPAQGSSDRAATMIAGAWISRVLHHHPSAAGVTITDEGIVHFNRGFEVEDLRGAMRAAADAPVGEIEVARADLVVRRSVHGGPVLATMAAGWLARGLEPDGWRRYDAALRTVTPDEVRAAARRYFAPVQLGVVFVDPGEPEAR